VILSIGLVWLYYSPLLAVKEIYYLGDRDQGTIERLEQLKQVPILSKRIGMVVGELLSKDLTLKELSCRRGLPQTLKCQIEKRKPVAIWKAANKNFLVDENGLAYTEVANSPVEGTSLEIEDRGNIPVEVGTFVLSRQILEKYQYIVNKLASNDLVVNRLILADATLYQVDAVVAPGPNYAGLLNKTIQLTVKFNLTNSLENQLASLLATLQSNGTQITERIDLRVNGIVYFK